MTATPEVDTADSAAAAPLERAMAKGFPVLVKLAGRPRNVILRVLSIDEVLRGDAVRLLVDAADARTGKRIRRFYASSVSAARVLEPEEALALGGDPL